MAALPNYKRCADKSKNDVLPPCINAVTPFPIGVLSISDLAHLGYCGCIVDNCNYLAGADRVCLSYSDVGL